MKTKTLTIITLILLLFASNAKAESDTDCWEEATPELCKRYNQAMAHVTEKWVEDFADSLIEVGEDEDKESYQYFGTALYSQRAFEAKDSVAFCEAIARQLQLAKACRYSSLYYRDRALIVNFLLSTNHAYQAERVGAKLISAARNDEDTQGIYYASLALSKLYGKVSDEKSALLFLNEALESARKCDMDKATISSILGEIASTYLKLGDTKKCAEYAKQAIVENPDNSHAYALSAECAFMSGKTDAFKSAAEKVRGCKAKNDTHYKNDMLNIRILTLASSGKTEAALALCDSLPSKGENLSRRIDILKKCGKWEQAFKTQKKLIDYEDSIIHADAKKGIADMNVKINTLFEVQREGAAERSKQDTTFTILMGIIAILLFIFIVMRGDSHRRN